MKNAKLFLVLLYSSFFFETAVSAQVRPVTLNERVVNSEYIVIGQLKEKHGFWDKAHQRLNTLNTFEVKAYLKGNDKNTTIAMITEGGVLGLEAVHACPSDDIEIGMDYMLFLKKEEPKWHDLAYAIRQPKVIQTKSHYVLAVLPYQNDQYIDLFGHFTFTEQNLLQELNKTHKLNATTPNGDTYSPRSVRQMPQVSLRTITNATDGTGSTPASGFIAGTIVSNNEIIINGSGFGASAGTIEFRNADAASGVQTLTNTSDLISWSDVQIRAKIPRRAGTGTVEVKTSGGASAGTTSITIAWAEICLDDPTRVSCVTSGGNIRHRLELANVDGTGGYLFRYNNGTGASANFSTSTTAKAAFERGIATWRCASLVNFNVSSTATSTGYANNDGISVVLYDDVSLPANALGVCTTSYNGNCSGACTNGIRWYHQDMDIRVLTVPVAGFTWNYTTSAPTGTQFDFETVMLHEVGHGHGLGHVIDVAKTMHYAVSNGVAKRTLSTAETNAGLFKISHSTATQCAGNRMVAISAGSCAVLSVELLSFTATNKGDNNLLNWQTATEINNSHFIVQRSKDGKNFTDIGTVKGAGTTTTPQYYNFTDDKPLNGINYYRLKQVDFDGQEDDSKIVSVNRLSEGKNILAAYPNPTHTVLTVEHTPSVQTLEIVNPLGQIIKIIKLKLDAYQTDINTTDLPNGIYFLRFNQTELIRFVKN